jgi:hypothetical protein
VQSRQVGRRLRLARAVAVFGAVPRPRLARFLGCGVAATRAPQGDAPNSQLAGSTQRVSEVGEGARRQVCGGVSACVQGGHCPPRASPLWRCCHPSALRRRPPTPSLQAAPNALAKWGKACGGWRAANARGVPARVQGGHRPPRASPLWRCCHPSALRRRPPTPSLQAAEHAGVVGVGRAAVRTSADRSCAAPSSVEYTIGSRFSVPSSYPGEDPPIWKHY